MIEFFVEKINTMFNKILISILLLLPFNLNAQDIKLKNGNESLILRIDTNYSKKYHLFYIEVYNINEYIEGLNLISIDGKKAIKSLKVRKDDNYIYFEVKKKEININNIQKIKFKNTERLSIFSYQIRRS